MKIISQAQIYNLIIESAELLALVVFTSRFQFKVLNEDNG